MFRTSFIFFLFLTAVCLSCGARAVVPDASVGFPSDSFEVRARDPIVNARLKGVVIAPKWVQATPVAADYFVAPIGPFMPFHLDLGLDPAVVLRSGDHEFAGRLVDTDLRTELVLIRCDAPAKTAGLNSETMEFLKLYFATWGKYVKDKPRL